MALPFYVHVMPIMALGQFPLGFIKDKHLNFTHAHNYCPYDLLSLEVIFLVTY